MNKRALIKKLAAYGLTGAVSFSAGIVGPFEGKENTSYIDIAGVPTICWGHTGSEVRLGQTLSDEMCAQLLAEDLGHAHQVVRNAVTAPQPPEREGALASFVYNVGAGAFQRSTLLRLLNAGRIREACDQLLRWVYADGEKSRGLERRRKVEREYCLAGVE